MKDPFFLTLEQVETLHRLGLQLHGGQEGLRDRAAFESATMHPQNAWFYGGGDIFDVAAAYAFHLAEFQAFIDGNKRAGMAAAITFLRLNGATVTSHTEELHAAMIAIAERRSGLLLVVNRSSGMVPARAGANVLRVNRPTSQVSWAKISGSKKTVC